MSARTADAVEPLLVAAGICDLFDGIVSADDQQTFKPNPDVYGASQALVLVLRLLYRIPLTGAAAKQGTDHVFLRVGAWDRDGLERRLRYCGRPPLTGERLAWAGPTANTACKNHLP